MVWTCRANRPLSVTESIHLTHPGGFCKHPYGNVHGDCEDVEDEYGSVATSMNSRGTRRIKNVCASMSDRNTGRREFIPEEGSGSWLRSLAAIANGREQLSIKLSETSALRPTAL
jgi:hypothetical protein